MSDLERFNDALDALIADRSPHGVLPDLDAEEQRMVRMAQLIRGSQAKGPAPEFVERVREEIADAPRPARVSRRAAFFSGAAALAAGVLAGVGIDRSRQSQVAPGTASGALNPVHGSWFQVANVADLPEGAVRAFTAGAVQGYLMNRGGNVRALSRICTHMGCALHFSGPDQTFQCPCHPVEFDMQGQYRYGPTQYYPHGLPPLPEIKVRIKGDAIEVLGA